MKKLLTLLTIALSLVLINHSCKPQKEGEEFDQEFLGSIYGVVTDKATGEPIKNANVQLRPTGETSLTGTDGRYEFLNIEDGNYSINVSKTGYTNLIDDYIITVDGTKAMRRDVQIEKLPASLKILNDYGNEISYLDFGEKYDDVSRVFNIFNDGTDVLKFQITKTASWIKSISVTSGSIEPGGTKSIIVNIDRDKLSAGINETTISITSNNGSKQLNVKAKYNAPGEIEGVVKDEYGTKIYSAYITLYKNGEFITTKQSNLINGQKNFRFEKLEPGKYTLEFECSGYKSETRTVNVQSGKTHNLEVLLEEDF